MALPTFGAQKPPMGTPGINPNAPDPRIPQGPVYGPPSPVPPLPQQPQQPQRPNPMEVPPAPPNNLSGMSPLSQIGLVLSDTAAGMRGASQMPSQVAVQQRQQMYQQKRQQWMQGLGLLNEMQTQLDSVPIAERQAKAAALRKQFEAWAGKGSGVMFDDVVGDGTLTTGMSEMMKKSPALQVIMAGGGSYSDMRQYMKSPQGIEEAITFQDDALLPTVQEKVKKLLNDPQLESYRQEAMKDGYLTVEEIAEINEHASIGPTGTRLGENELATMRRRETDVVQATPGMRTRKELENIRKLQDEQPFKLAQKIASGKGPISDPLTRQIALQGFKDAGEIIEKNDAVLSDLDLSETMLRDAERILEERRTNTGRFAGSAPGQLIQSILNEADMNTLQQAFGQQWITAVQGMRGLGPLSDREGAAILTTVGGMDKDDAFNLRDIRRRLAKIGTVREAKAVERDLAKQTRDGIARRAGMDGIIQTAPRAFGPNSGTSPTGPKKATAKDLTAIADLLGVEPDADGNFSDDGLAVIEKYLQDNNIEVE